MNRLETTDLCTLLLVDDEPSNLHVLKQVLQDSYHLLYARNGKKALELSLEKLPDLILLDVMMPELSGYEVCKQLKQNPLTANIPVIFVSALSDTTDETQGFEMGAVDYITKPISIPILRVRIKNHLALRQQAIQLEKWNRELEQRVADGVAEMEKLNRLRRFFSPAVAELIVGDSAEDPWKTHRREIVVVFLDLRGYTSFTEAFGADEVMRVLGEFHAAMGERIMAYSATLERFTGDGMMIFFNDPIEIPEPAVTAAKMAVEMRQCFLGLQEIWRKRGYCLDLGMGIAQGVATLGAIGFEGRRDYGAIGRVTNLAARLCGKSSGGQILVCERVASNAAKSVNFVVAGELKLKGFTELIKSFSIAV